MGASGCQQVSQPLESFDRGAFITSASPGSAPVAGRSVALALASFRHDTAVLQLLDEVLSGPDAGLFDPILVVDSLGTGRIQAAIADRGWTGKVVYHTADTNLGSAGNLARRLELAAAAGAEWVFAVNQDGEIRADSVRKMAQVGRSLPRIGAVYPLRRKVNKEGRYDFTGKSALPLPFIGEHRAPVEPLVDVHWGSSNGTLYALAPIREGLTP